MSESENKLKMFVWQGVLQDYTCGMVAVLAYDVDHARKLAYQKCNYKLDAEPKIVTEPEAFLFRLSI